MSFSRTRIHTRAPVSAAALALLLLGCAEHGSNVTGGEDGGADSSAMNVGEDGGIETDREVSIGGTVVGLTGDGLVLENNGGDPLAVNGDGPFTFSTKIRAGARYDVRIRAQPVGRGGPLSGLVESCVVTEGASAAASDVTSVTIACTHVLLFSAGDDDQLWKTDGTTDGTALVAELLAGPRGSNLRDFVAARGSVLFFADNPPAGGVTSSSLYRTDGTSSGTVRIAADVDADSRPVVWNGVAYFGARERGHGIELFRTDGTAAGTQRVADIDRGSGDSSPRALTVFGDALYFFAHEPTVGHELWRSDGTGSGTVLVANIHPTDSSATSKPELIELGGSLLFAADDDRVGRELWRSDGTESGTALLVEIVNGPSGGFPRSMIRCGGNLFFAAATATTGVELYRTNGTSEGTVFLGDIGPGTFSGFDNRTTCFEGTLFFSANDLTSGNELWKSDGTPEGTALFADIVPGSGGSRPERFFEHDGLLFFSANGGIHRTDGTTPGTTRVHEVASSVLGALPDGNVYFEGRANTVASGLFRTNGVDAAVLVKRFR